MQRKTIKLFWHYSKPHARRRTLAFAFSAISIVLESYVATYILSLFMNYLQKGNVTFQGAVGYIVPYVVVLFLSLVITWRVTLWAAWSFEIRGQRDLAKDILAHLSRQSLSFHNDRFGGALISQTTKLIGAFERFWDVLLWDTMPVVTGVVAASIILWPISPVYSALIIGVAVIFTTTVFFGSRFTLKRSQEEVAAYSAMTGFIADVITNMSTVKSFGSERTEQRSGYKRQTQWMNKSLSTMRGVIAVSTAYAILLVSFYAAVLFYTAYLASQQTLPVGSIYLLVTYAVMVGWRLWGVNGIMRNYNRLMGDAHDMVEIMNLPVDIVDTVKAKPLDVPRGEIVFDAMSFAHDGRKGSRIFDDFSLTIKPGERIGLVGHSGSGKTTLTRLLLRFNDLDDGRILIDGTDIATVTQQSLRESISYVAQEPMLFHRSLSDNIAYGKPNATEAEIKQAANLAYADEFIETLADGYDTPVGERGIKLSGGQRQRVAIARAILKDAPILVLDEATSALDSESEKLIQASLDNLMKGRTSLVIAHRLSTIAKLDRIIVLEDGKVAEDGSHIALIEKNGIYARLWKHQSGGFIEE